MIESLTQSQKDRLPEFREKWIKIGLCTDPANRKEAEEAIRQSYVLAGLVPPEEMIWYGSPLSIIDAVKEIILGNSVRNSIGESVWSSVRDSMGSVGYPVWNFVRDSMGSVAPIWNFARNSMGSVGYPVWNFVRDSMGSVAPVWNFANPVWNVRDSMFSVSRSVRNSIWETSGVSVIEDFVSIFCYGQHDVDFLSFYDYLREVVGLREETEKVTGLIEVARHAGWWAPYEKVCLVSERHNFLSLDERGRLHSLSGPAITYPNGWKVYAVHGVMVPEKVILAPESQTIQEIQEEKNIEVRRIRIERYGWLSYLRMIDAKMLDRRKNDIEGTNEALMRSPNENVLVCACPSTGRVYALQVPQEINSCEQAQNWLSGGLNGRITAAT